MHVIEAKNLKEYFEELKKLKDFTLLPVFDAAVKEFIADLKQSYSKYGITDYMEVEHPGEGIWKFVNNTYHLVIDGKIVAMNIRRTDINVINDDDYWWMTEKIEFAGDDAGVNKLVERMNNFICKLKLNDLLRAATEELRKGKTYLLGSEMREFYLNS